MSPKEQFTEVHPATCNSCKTHIIGIRFKVSNPSRLRVLRNAYIFLDQCLHPDCVNFDLCQHCEALPISVHPENHPLVKFKHDYVGETHTDFSKVFEFVRNGGLQQELYRQTIPSDGEHQRDKPVVQVLIPRPELDLDANAVSPRSEADFPRVPTDEPMPVTNNPVIVSMPAALLQLESPQVWPVAPPESVQAMVAPMDAPIDQLLTEPILPSTPEAQPTRVEATSLPKSPNSLTSKCPATVGYNAVFVADNSVEDGHVFPAGAEFVKSWRLRNNGSVAWPESTVVAFMGGDRCGAAKSSPMEYHVGSVAAGAFADVHVEDMKAPSGGRYVSYWRLRDNATSQVFGDQLWCEYVP